MPDQDAPTLLHDLLRAAGPSGYEGPAAKVWREAAGFAELTRDTMGSTVALIGGETEGPLFAVVGHIDEIGLVVTHIDEKGFAWFEPIGGWDPQILIGQRVEVQSKSGPVPGVCGRKPIHLLKPDQRKKVVELSGLHIDIGAADGDRAKELIRVGDPVVVLSEPVAVDGNRLVSKSMDNRLGAYVALEATRRVKERGTVVGAMAGVAAAQEEIGLFGAGTSAFSLAPDLAIAVDVTHASDAPGIEEKETGVHPLGSGPVIQRGATLSPIVSDLLIEVAEREGIDYTLEASGRGTHTDADAIAIARGGIPAGVVSIPLRYMHSPVEMVDLGDVEAVIELICAFAAALTPDIELTR